MATEKEKAFVRKRARYRCEYCRAPESVAGYAFHIEHIRPRNHGGNDNLSNYALSCMPCNRGKWDHLTGEDPQTNKQERLFHPRKDKWDEHFRVAKHVHIEGKTPIGRTTVERLKMNEPRQLEARGYWRELELYP